VNDFEEDLMTTHSSQTASKSHGLLRQRGTTDATAVTTKPRGGALLRSEGRPTDVESESRIAALVALMSTDEPAAAAPAPFTSTLEQRAANEDTVVDSKLAERIATEVARAPARPDPSGPHATALVRAPRIGEYRLLGSLASGRTSHVYLARLAGPAGFARHLAIKLLRDEHQRDPDRVLAFVDNARLLSTLHHGNIAQICDVGIDGETHYVVMDYLHGMDLRAMMQRCPGGLSLAFAITAISGCAEALHYARLRQAHDARQYLGIAPSYVMACTDGAIKLVHLGHTRYPGPTPEDHELAYLAPEHARGDAADARSEVFVLGVMLYELITGAHPYLDSSPELTFLTARDRLLHTEAEPLANRMPHLAGELCTVVMTAVARDPHSRYRDCREFGAALLDVAERLALRAGPFAVRQLVNQFLGTQPAKRADLKSNAVTHVRVVADSNTITNVRIGGPEPAPTNQPMRTPANEQMSEPVHPQMSEPSSGVPRMPPGKAATHRRMNQPAHAGATASIGSPTVYRRTASPHSATLLARPLSPGGASPRAIGTAYPVRSDARPNARSDSSGRHRIARGLTAPTRPVDRQHKLRRALETIMLCSAAAAVAAGIAIALAIALASSAQPATTAEPTSPATTSGRAH
jgi:eukaryotic-like serine/threonine-protein kinase